MSGAREALAARLRWPGETFVRRARCEHGCRGRFYDANGCALPGERCREPIRVGDLHIEYVGEAAAYQSGERYHVACAVREGLVLAEERATSAEDAESLRALANRGVL